MNDLLSFYVFPFVLMAGLAAFMGMIKSIRKYSIVGIIYIFSCSILLLLLRDPHAPADSANYVLMYNDQVSFRDIFSAYHRNVFFSFTQYLGNVFGIDAKSFLIYQTIGIYILTVIGLCLIFKSNKMLLTVLSLFVLTSTFVLLYTNVIRQGLALALIIVATGLFLNKYRSSAFWVLALAIFSHFSAIIIMAIFLFVRFFKMNKRFCFFFLLAIPFLPIFSHFLLSNLALLGGVFNKIETLSGRDYNNKLVYIKILNIYFFLILFYFYGTKGDFFSDFNYFFIFKIYLMIVAVVAFSLPVLLLSSRYLYYASAYLPILFTFVLYHQKNIFSLDARFYVGFLMTLFFGFFVYSFQSVRMQLGI